MPLEAFTFGTLWRKTR